MAANVYWTGLKVIITIMKLTRDFQFNLYTVLPSNSEFDAGPQYVHGPVLTLECMCAIIFSGHFHSSI